MTAIIFLGPSCSAEVAVGILPAIYRPPAKRGDIYQAARERPDIIGLVDGVFETAPSVLHKEILWAMKEGVTVVGAASMGALRAAELAEFGMKGVGLIFESYAKGEIEDDDEVAVLHGPKELGYPPISEAMVNMRQTLYRAQTEGILSEETVRVAERLAKRKFYKERSYRKLIKAMSRAELPPIEVAAFERWLPEGQVNQKKIDTIELLKEIARQLSEGVKAEPADFTFRKTRTWQQLEQEFLKPM